MIFRHIQPSFSGGEYSAALYARIDISKYASGLRTCRNFIVQLDGGASNRPGLKYRAEVKTSTSATIVKEFIFSESQAYILEFGQEYVRFFTKDGQVTNSGTPYEVTTPYDSTDVADLRFESSADTIYIFHNSYQTRTLSRIGNAQWELDTYQPDDGPFMSENILDNSSMSVSAVTGDTTLTISTVIETNIKLLLHFDGTNGSTTFNDETGKSVTANGDVQISTAQSVFGGASGYFDGTGDYLSIADNSDWDIFGSTSGDYTISMRLRTAETTAERYVITQREDSSNRWAIRQDAGGALRLLYIENTNVRISATTSTTLSADTWYHVALVKKSNVFALYINGVQETYNTFSTTDTFAGSILIGTEDGTQDYWNGWIDELIITTEDIYSTTPVVGVTDSFTVPTSENSLTNIVSDFTFDPLHVGALFQLRHYVEGQAVTAALASVTTTSSIKCFTTWRLITHGTWNGTIRVEKSEDGGTTWTNLRQFSSENDFNANTSGTEDIETTLKPFLVRVNMTVRSAGTCNVDLTTDAFYQVGVVRATAYNSPTSMDVTVISEVSSTSETTMWSEGAWSDYRGYPAHGRFFQDRLVTANSTHQPTSFWITRTGNYTSYYRHASLIDSDAIIDNLAGRQLNAINGIIALRNLIFLTSGSEWTLTFETALTPTSYQKQVQGYRGSSGVAPIVIGNEALFMQSNNQTVRSIGYEFASDSFTGSDLSVLSRHLFKRYSIVKMAYQQDPDSVVWAVRSDGKLLGCTYMREQEVVAWHHHDTDGEIESVAVIPAGTYDQVWFVVKRTIEGATKRYIESFVERMASTSLEDQFFVDSGLTYDGTPASTITGLDHLEGEVVSILADGTVHDTRTVSSGSITLDNTYSVVQAGLQYLSDLETLDVEIPSQSGTLQGTKVKIGNVTFRFIESRGGYLGPDSNNLYEAFTKSQLENGKDYTLGDSELFTDDSRQQLGAGYTRGGRLFYRQSDPLPVTISAIIPELTAGGPSS